MRYSEKRGEERRDKGGISAKSLFGSFLRTPGIDVYCECASREPVAESPYYADRRVWRRRGNDLTTMTFADVVGSLLKQRIVVMNKPGGTSSVVLSALKAEKPDGYMVGVMPSGGILASLLRKVPYDPIKDFTPISGSSPHYSWRNPRIGEFVVSASGSRQRGKRF